MFDHETVYKAKQRDPEALQKVFKQSEQVLSQYLANWETNISPDALKVRSRSLTLKALDTYDPSKGVKFNTHLYNNFKKLSRDIMYYSDSIRMPENQRLKVGKLQSSIEELKDQLGREPSTQELAEHLGWNFKETERLIKNITKEMPTDLDISTVYSEWSPRDLILHSMYQDLNPREQTIFEHTIGYGGKPELPAKEIAKKVGMSEASITNIRKKLASELVKRLQDSGAL